MKSNTLYTLSLAFTILLTLAAFITLLGWFGTFINGAGHLPILALLPWKTLGLVVLAAVNCTVRAQLIVRKRQTPAEA